MSKTQDVTKGKGRVIGNASFMSETPQNKSSSYYRTRKKALITLKKGYGERSTASLCVADCWGVGRLARNDPQRVFFLFPFFFFLIIIFTLVFFFSFFPFPFYHWSCLHNNGLAIC